MDKVEGAPLSQIWSTMQLQQRLKVIIAMTRLQFHSRITAACTMQEMLSPPQAVTISRMAEPLKIQSLLLARLLTETGLTRADQI